jgi:hypothetical protein
MPLYQLIGIKVDSNARVAELVDALDLGSSAVRRESSSLSFRTSSNASVVKLVYTRDLKSLAEGLVGSSPTIRTKQF